MNNTERSWYDHPIFMFAGRALLAVALWVTNEIRLELNALRESQNQQVAALRETQVSIAALVRDLQLKTSSRWTQIDQTVWATLLAQKNPTIIVPTPVHNELPGETAR
jgi:hypothetical protein